MVSIKDGGSITRSIRCHECKVSYDSEEFGRALISIVVADESAEDSSSNGHKKFSMCK